MKPLLIMWFCWQGLPFLLLLLLIQAAFSAEVPFQVHTPATVLCKDPSVGCCPSNSTAYVKPLGLQDHTEFREYGDNFYCNAEECQLTEHFNQHFVGPAYVVCPSQVSSQCQAQDGTLYNGSKVGDTIVYNNLPDPNTLTYVITKAQPTTCSSSCEVRATSQEWTGHVQLNCGDNYNNNPFGCVENGTNTVLNATDNNNVVTIDYFQVARCPTSCQAVTQGIVLIGPAVAGCGDCFEDRGLPAPVTTAMDDNDNSTTVSTDSVTTEADYGQILRCPNNCTVISNSTEIHGPALITCNPENEQQESTLLPCLEDDGTNLVPTTESNYQQFFVDTSRTVRCDTRCSVQGWVRFSSPTTVECTSPTFGCYSDQENATPAMLFPSDSNTIAFTAKNETLRCHADKCKLVQGVRNGIVVQGPAHITCGSNTLGCEGSISSSTGKDDSTVHAMAIGTTGKCDPNCKVVQHRIIHGPTTVSCPEGHDTTTGPQGFSCVGQNATPTLVEKQLLYNVDCGETAYCNENCKIGDKKVGAEPEVPAETPGGATSGSRRWRWCLVVFVSAVLVGVSA